MTTYKIKTGVTFWAFLTVACFAYVSAEASQSHCMSYWTAAYKCSQGCGSCGSSNNSSGSYNGPNLWNILKGSSGPSAAEIADQQARAANEQGVQAYNRRDWASAIGLFKQALQNYPNDPTYRQNLINAENNLANQQAKEKAERDERERLRQNKIAADNMQQSIQNFAQTLNASPISGGLDFDGRTSANAPDNGNSVGLDFTSNVSTPVAKPGKSASKLPSGDTRVVDARNVPSGLPKDVENAIAGAYQNAPPGVSDRVRKGFQAVMESDWKVAKAWFQDALKLDPANVGLRRFVLLAGQTPERNKQAAPPKASPVSKMRQPSADDVYYYVPSMGYYRMSLEDATLRQLWDETLGIPPGSIINIR